MFQKLFILFVSTPLFIFAESNSATQKVTYYKGETNAIYIEESEPVIIIAQTSISSPNQDVNQHNSIKLALVTNQENKTLTAQLDKNTPAATVLSVSCVHSPEMNHGKIPLSTTPVNILSHCGPGDWTDIELIYHCETSGSATPHELITYVVTYTLVD